MSKNRKLDVFTERNRELAHGLSEYQAALFCLGLANAQTTAQAGDIVRAAAERYPTSTHIAAAHSALVARIAAAGIESTRRAIAERVGSACGSIAEAALTEAAQA